MQTHGLSIIIPCFNAGSFILEAVRSIHAQPARVKYEVILIDDGSTDQKTLTHLERLEDHKSIKLIHLNANMGAQYARNVGLLNAKYDFIFMMDADDVLNSNKSVLSHGCFFDRATELLHEHKDIAFVHTKVINFDGYGGVYHHSPNLSEKLILSKHHVPTFIIYRKIDALQGGMYLNSVEKWQDWTFAIALLNSRFTSGKKNYIHYFEQPYYLYRQHDKTKRISKRNICERAMTSLTVEKYQEIFSAYYPHTTPENILEQLLTKEDINDIA